MTTFYIIVKEENGTLVAAQRPRQHLTYKDAVIEAERLAKQAPGHLFIVMSAKVSVISEPVVKTTHTVYTEV